MSFNREPTPIRIRRSRPDDTLIAGAICYDYDQEIQDPDMWNEDLALIIVVPDGDKNVHVLHRPHYKTYNLIIGWTQARSITTILIWDEDGPAPFEKPFNSYGASAIIAQLAIKEFETV